MHQYKNNYKINFCSYFAKTFQPFERIRYKRIVFMQSIFENSFVINGLTVIRNKLFTLSYCKY